jgi:hypothetical protein
MSQVRDTRLVHKRRLMRAGSRLGDKRNSNERRRLTEENG